MELKRQNRDFEMFATRVAAAINLRTYNSPISAGELAANIGSDERTVKAAVCYLRRCGFKIASSKGRYDPYIGVNVPNGFYLARNEIEMRSTIEMFNDQIRESIMTVKKLADFSGEEQTLFSAEIPTFEEA